MMFPINLSSNPTPASFPNLKSTDPTFSTSEPSISEDSQPKTTHQRRLPEEEEASGGCVQRWRRQAAAATNGGIWRLEAAHGWPGWHIYFWMSFIPLIILLVVGTKLEHIITKLAHEVAERNSVVQGELIVNLSNYHFWFHRPRIVLYLVHFILFENAFEIAFFFWILITYGFDSCIMERVVFIVHKLVVSVIIQLLCSYSTLPLYAIVTQMGTLIKADIFQEHVQEGLMDWANHAKKHKGKQVSNVEDSPKGTSVGTQLQSIVVHKNTLQKRSMSLLN